MAQVGTRRSLELCPTRVLLDRIRACSFVRLTRVLHFSFGFPFENVIVNLLLNKNSNSAAALRRFAECIFIRTLTRVHCSRPRGQRSTHPCVGRSSCLGWKCTDLCFLSKLKCQLRDDLLLLFKRPFMKFVFEPHKNLSKASSHLKEEIKSWFKFHVKNSQLHSWAQVERLSGGWSLAKPWLSCVVFMSLSSLFSCYIFWYQFTWGLHQPSPT